MYNLIRRNRRTVLMLIDTIAIALSFLVAFLLRFDFFIPEEFVSLLYYWLPVFIAIQILFFNLSGFYDVIWRFTSLWEMLNIIKWVSISCFTCFIALGFYNGWVGFPRSVLLIFYLLNVLTICLSRVSVRIYYSHFHQSPFHNLGPKKRLILIGAGKTGEKIAREIMNTPTSPYRIIGFMDDDPRIQGASLHGIKVIGRISELKNIMIPFDELLITAPSATGDQMREIVKACKATGKRYKTVPSLAELIDKDVSLASIRDVSYLDLLGREEVKLDMIAIEDMLHGKRVLITGAGGSIGSELVNQCLKFNPSEIICLDSNEEKIYHLITNSKNIKKEIIVKPVLGSVKDKNHLLKVFNDNRPQIIFHAAAYKHVPIQEIHPWTAVETNVSGTLNMIKLADQYQVEKFVFVSTDKAVNPVNVMGATKRISEKLIQSRNVESDTEFIAVRFGNVLGSSGSAIPTFETQINNGGPVTITHPEMTRYFMSIQEASQLILQSGAIGSGGEILLLEMGKPIKIDQMARDLIRLSGLEPGLDIPIVYTGLRPGEKLYEELHFYEENITITDHKKIMILKDNNEKMDWNEIKFLVEDLIQCSESLDRDKIQVRLKKLAPSYQPRSLFKSVEDSNIPPGIRGEA